MWFGNSTLSLTEEETKRKKSSGRRVSLVDALSKYVLHTDRRRIKGPPPASRWNPERISSAY